MIPDLGPSSKGYNQYFIYLFIPQFTAPSGTFSMYQFVTTVRNYCKLGAFKEKKLQPDSSAGHPKWVSLGPTKVPSELHTFGRLQERIRSPFLEATRLPWPAAVPPASKLAVSSNPSLPSSLTCKGLVIILGAPA